MMTPRIRQTIAATILGIAFTGSGQAQAVRTWVSTFGLDTAPCTRVEPCRTFDVAIEAVSPGGEVVPLDSGGYGTFEATQAVAILVPKGIHAAVAGNNTTAVRIGAGSLDRVTLRGLFINSIAGSIVGVAFDSGSVLSIEGCVLRGLITGIFADRLSTDSFKIFVSDTTIQDGDYGMMIGSEENPGHGAVERCRFLNNSQVALYATQNSRVAVRNTVLSGNATGVLGTGSGSEATELMLDHCMVSGNTTRGIEVMTDATLRLVACSVTYNTTGVIVGPTATGHSLGNNLISGNGTNVTGTLAVIPGK